MKSAAIIAEYNPFHNGHKFLISETRKLGYDCIVAVLGGNFTQRGDISVFSKEVKCRAALSGGADLVIELPVPYVLAPAERFAYGGINIIGASQCIDAVSFGSECGDIELLKAAADAAYDINVDCETATFLSSGISYPAAKSKAIEKIFGKKVSDVLSRPNNLLAAEYLHQLNAYPNIVPITLKRTIDHDSDKSDSSFASASYIRKLIFSKENYSKYVPKEVQEIYSEAILNKTAPCDVSKLEVAILSKLRFMDVDDFACLPDVSEGFENRLYYCSRKARSLEEFYSLSKTKRYTMSRIKRITMNAFLGISPELQKKFPPYIRILGFNAAGETLVRKMKNLSSLPVSSSLKKLCGFSEDGRIFAETEERCGNQFYLSMDSPYFCGSEFKYKIQKYKEETI